MIGLVLVGVWGGGVIDVCCVDKETAAGWAAAAAFGFEVEEVAGLR